MDESAQSAFEETTPCPLRLRQAAPFTASVDIPLPENRTRQVAQLDQSTGRAPEFIRAVWSLLSLGLCPVRSG
ncbi:hypothetical protein [Mycolicibacterium sp. XJ883]